MSVDQDVDVNKVTNLAKKYKWILIAGLFVTVVPAILILKNVIALGIAGILGFGLIQFADVISLKIANWRMKAITAEIQENPIESLKNLYAEKATHIEEASKKIIEFDTEIRNYDDQLDAFKKQYPKKSKQYVEVSDKMHKYFELMKSEQDNANDALKDLALEIKEAEAIFKMALAAQKVTALSQDAESKVFAEIKQQIAFDSVRSRVNKTFANLDMAIKKKEDTNLTLMLEHQEENTVELPVEQKEKQQ